MWEWSTWCGPHVTPQVAGGEWATRMHHLAMLLGRGSSRGQAIGANHSRRICQPGEATANPQPAQFEGIKNSVTRTLHFTPRELWLAIFEI